VSQVARLTGTPPEFAYNLALAGFYATLVTTAYGIAAGIAARVDVPHRLAGGIAVFFVGFASNLGTAVNLVFAVLPTDVATDVADALGYDLHGLAAGFEHFSYWTASRIIPGTINEFPLFAWLNGDMHAHMMSTSFTLLAAGLLAAYAWLPAERVWRRRLIVFGLLPALAGTVAVVNTWSFPTVGGLTLLGLSVASASPASLLPAAVARHLDRRSVLADEAIRLSLAVAFGGLVVLGGLAWSAPFWAESATSRPLGVFPDRSPLAGLLVVHGVFLLLFGSYLLRMAGARAADARRGAVLSVLVLGLGAAVGMAGPTLLVLLIVLGWVTLRASRLDGRLAEAGATESPADPTVADGGDGPALPRPDFETVLLVAGLGLVLLVEFAHVDEGGAAPRFNTVFKVYMQVWILFGTAAGVVLARLLAERDPRLPASGDRWRRGFRVLAAVLVVTTSIYGSFALVSHVDGTQLDTVDELTLDATAFVDVEHADEAPAIDWIDDLEGQPTIVTGAPGGYTWDAAAGKGASAPASLTGVPTVLGWFHEAQYRGDETYRPRLEAVRTIYTGAEGQQSAALRRYDVAYVYVGPAERARSDDVTITDHPALTVAASFEHVTVYAVRQSALVDG
jgi:YYY domain-containing protein